MQTNGSSNFATLAWVKSIKSAVWFIAFGAVLAGSTLAAQPTPDRALDIYFVDVLGGAATVLISGDRESILVDSGWPGFDDRDPKRIVRVIKDRAGCDHLDHLVTTHWHRDHFGGVEGLARLIRIDHFWDRGLPEDRDSTLDFPDGPSESDALGAAYRKASSGKRKALRPGDTLPLSGLKAIVLASGGKVIDRPAATGTGDGANANGSNSLCDQAPADQPVDVSDNARSLVLLFTLGKFRFFDAGDLTWNVERKLVCPIDLIGKVDLFQVTHHGMDSSNNPVLVRTLSPTVAIMNNGPHKGGGAGTVKLLKSIGSIHAAYQLHRNADTAASDNTDPELIANTAQAGGEYIHVRVEADGSKFTVQIGEHGPVRTFETH
jgi:beta-lactamase superfamily II metal-dependent hydrolase